MPVMPAQSPPGGANHFFFGADFRLAVEADLVFPDAALGAAFLAAARLGAAFFRRVGAASSPASLSAVASAAGAARFGRGSALGRSLGRRPSVRISVMRRSVNSWRCPRL